MGRRAHLCPLTPSQPLQGTAPSDPPPEPATYPQAPSSPFCHATPLSGHIQPQAGGLLSAPGGCCWQPRCLNGLSFNLLKLTPSPALIWTQIPCGHKFHAPAHAVFSPLVFHCDGFWSSLPHVPNPAPPCSSHFSPSRPLQSHVQDSGLCPNCPWWDCCPAPRKAAL